MVQALLLVTPLGHCWQREQLYQKHYLSPPIVIDRTHLCHRYHCHYIEWNKGFPMVDREVFHLICLVRDKDSKYRSLTMAGQVDFAKAR